MNQRAIIAELVTQRTLRRITQGQIAAAMGTTQSRVSKLERKTDDALTLGELRSYADAVGLEIPFILQKKIVRKTA